MPYAGIEPANSVCKAYLHNYAYEVCRTNVS
ncbi:hypothetical protein V3C99_005309 [Haemonchus contortus]